MSATWLEEQRDSAVTQNLTRRLSRRVDTDLQAPIRRASEKRDEGTPVVVDEALCAGRAHEL